MPEKKSWPYLTTLVTENFGEYQRKFKGVITEIHPISEFIQTIKELLKK